MNPIDQTELAAIIERQVRRLHQQEMPDINWLVGLVGRQQGKIDELQRQLAVCVEELADLKEK